MRKRSESSDFQRYLAPLLSVLEKPPKQRTEDELDQIVFILRRARLFVEICKLAQSYEIKELLKYADIVRKEMGDILNEHQHEVNSLYIIASGQLWSLNVRQLAFAERIAPLSSLGQHPVWWYLADPDRLRNQFNTLVDQMIKRQGKVTISDLSDMMIIQRRQQNSNLKDTPRTQSRSIQSHYDNQTNPEITRWSQIKQKITVPTEQQHRVVYHPGDIFTSRVSGVQYDESNISLQIPLLFPKQNCVMIRIPEFGFTQFYLKILNRLKSSELEYFRQLYIFQDLSRIDVENLHGNAKIFELRRGTIVFKRGDPVNEFYVVRQGDIELSTSCPVSLISEGQFIGEVDVLLNEPIRQHTATIKSQQSVLYQFSMADYQRLITSKSKEDQNQLIKVTPDFFSSRTRSGMLSRKVSSGRPNQLIPKSCSMYTMFSYRKTPRSISVVEPNQTQPLRRKLVQDSPPYLIGKSFDFRSNYRPSSRMELANLFATRQSVVTNGRVRSSSSQSESHTRMSRKRDRNIQKTNHIRLNNPLVNHIELHNDRLNQIKTVKGYYNRISNKIFAQYRVPTVANDVVKCKTSPLSTQFDELINQPPQHLRKAIGYLRERVGQAEPDIPTTITINRFRNFKERLRATQSRSVDHQDDFDQFSRYQDTSIGNYL